MARDIQDNVHKMQSTCLANSKELGRSVSIWLLRRRGSNQYLELRPAHTCDVLVACSTSWTKTLSHCQQNAWASSLWVAVEGCMQTPDYPDDTGM